MLKLKYKNDEKFKHLSTTGSVGIISGRQGSAFLE
jgi:hypothetical protein